MGNEENTGVGILSFGTWETNEKGELTYTNNMKFQMQQCDIVSNRKDAVYYTDQEASYSIVAKIRPPKSQKDIYDWFHVHSTNHSGLVKISMLNSNAESITRYFKFNSGEIIYIQNIYSAMSDSNYMTLTIVVSEFEKIDSVIFKNQLDENALVPVYIGLKLDNSNVSQDNIYFPANVTDLPKVTTHDISVGYPVTAYTRQHGRYPQYLKFTLQQQPDIGMSKALYDSFNNGTPISLSLFMNEADSTSGNAATFAYSFDGYIAEIRENYSTNSTGRGTLNFSVAMYVNKLTINIRNNPQPEVIYHV